MKETIAEFESRTGLRYSPTEVLRALGQPLSAGEACPTLFRYPGPEGLREFLRGGLKGLAPAGRPAVWLSGDPRGPAGQPEAVRLFGTVALLEPLRLSPCASPEKGTYLGANLPLGGLEGLVWVPPSLVTARLPWDRVRSADDVRRHAGSRHDAQQGRILEQLGLYLEELAELRRVGAPGETKAWCALPKRARRRLLDRYGVAPSWTAS